MAEQTSVVTPQRFQEGFNYSDYMEQIKVNKARFEGFYSNFTVQQTEAEILYKEAKKLVEDNQYLMAIEKLNKIQSEHPYSFYATPSELLRADVYFKQKNFQ